MEPLEIEQPQQLDVGGRLENFDSSRDAPPASNPTMKRVVVYGSMAACMLVIMTWLARWNPKEQVHPTSSAELATELVGGSRDEGGCLTSAGYSFCPQAKKCIRPWVESCPLGVPFCQEYCKKKDAEKSAMGVEVTCRCKGNVALDYAPPACADLGDYAESLASPCEECQQGVAVIGGNCAFVTACNDAVNGLSLLDSLDACEQKCFPRQAKSHVQSGVPTTSKPSAMSPADNPKCDAEKVALRRNTKI